MFNNYFISDEFKSLVEALQKVPKPHRHLVSCFLFPNSIVVTYNRNELSRHFGYEFSKKDFDDFCEYFGEHYGSKCLEDIYWRWLGWKEYHAGDSANPEEDSE